MKKIIALTLLIFSTATFSTFARDSMVDLAGCFPEVATRSLSQPITIIQHTEYIETSFSSNNLGKIVVVIQNETNTEVYRHVVDTSVEDNCQISLLNYKEGNYRISFTSAKGKMYGNFVIQK